MGILGSILGKRDSGMAYRTVDGGHPAPYPDMTDEQLYNYETAFNVPHRTFDRPPAPAPVARTEERTWSRREEPFIQHDEIPPGQQVRDERVFDAPRYMSNGAQAADAARAAHVHRAGDEAEAAGVTATASAASAATAASAASFDTAHPAPPAQPSKAPAAPLDFSRPVRLITTKQPVEIITTRARHPIYKVQGYIGDDEVVTVFTSDGRLSENGLPYLENVPDMDHLFLNIYLNRDGISTDKYVVTQHPSREAADAEATASAAKGKGERLTCVDVQLDA